MRLKILSVFTCLLSAQFAIGQGMGNWKLSSKDLPVYEFTSKIPVKALDKEGKDAMLPDDPYFMLGNYRMTLFTHVSGIYQFMTGERGWARINGVPQANYGWNEAIIFFKKDKKNIKLTGLNSISANPDLVKKKFGVGFANYQYQLDNGIVCTRTLSVKPSAKINSGNPSFIITVNIQNKGKKTQDLSYSEKMLVNYTMCSTQFTEQQNRPLIYPTDFKLNQEKHLAIADISYKVNTFLLIPDVNDRYIYNIKPTSVYLFAKEGMVNFAKDTVSSVNEIRLKPGSSTTFDIVIGLADKNTFEGVKSQVNDLFEDAKHQDCKDGLFTDLWKNKLPDFSAEKDKVIKREMLWNAHVVEASATYSDYYKQTFIPQGVVYSYHFGDNISNRDHLQAALPACYTNPALAKSAIKYVIMHSETDGEIKRGDSGNGYTPPSLNKESDEQLYFFNTIAEYLLITKDYNFLKEKVVYYPAEDDKTEPLVNMLKKYFIYLRDEVGTGQIGLVKILNSDWSDSFFHEYSPNKYSWAAESHLNSAMVLAIFPKLQEALKNADAKENKVFIDALESYRQKIETVYMKDLGNRKFSARAYLTYNLRFGVDVVCIEPQGYLLQIPTISNERKAEMYTYIKSKILAPEKIGVRTREKKLWSGKPDGEDGGIWYSLEYPVLLGVATFDKQEAWSLLKKFSFQNYAAQYPNYWVGQWTAPDDLNSTLSTREGLFSFWEPDIRRSFQGYCSHPHTWPLYCYYKLKEN